MSDPVALAIARIRAQVTAFASRVAGAAELQAAIDEGEQFAVPHAWVVYAGEDAAEPTTAGLMMQPTRIGLAVVVCVDNTADRRGAQATDSMFALRAALLAALLGWNPDEAACFGPLEYEGGELVEMTRARLWHQFNFVLPWTVQQA